MKTKRISLLLALFMFVGVILSGTTVFATNVNETEKDVVFLIDRSMYSNREDLKVINENISRLSAKLLESSQSTRISVLDFNDHAQVLVKNSRDLEEINNSLRVRVPFGFSNPEQAVKTAVSISDVKDKDIVLFTSIYPNIGRIDERGIYNSRDHFYFRNANSYRNYLQRLDESVRIFTVSNFSKLSNKDYGFAKRVFKENSDAFFEVSEKSEIDAAYENIEALILGGINPEEPEELKKPIVFVPGLAGSELFKINEEEVDDIERATGMIGGEKEKISARVWLPFVFDMSQLGKDLNVSSTLYGLNQGDLRKVNFFERHSGPAAQYSILIDKLISNFPDRPIYLFSYDWRNTNVDAAEKLNAFIDTITDGGKVKVDLLAHSMGGLVSSHFLRDHNEKVDKYLSFGTPYEGAPSALQTMMNDSMLGDLLDNLFKDGLNYDLKDIKDFDGILELLPTERMLEKYPFLTVTDSALFNRDLFENGNRSYEKLLKKVAISKSAQPMYVDELNHMVSEKVGFERFAQFIKDASSYRKDRQIENEVLLFNRPDSMFILGTGKSTMVAGCFEKTAVGLSGLRALSTTEGDGLVPVYSATMGVALEDMDEATRDRFRVANETHMGLLSNPKTLNMMTDFLNDRPVSK